MTGTDTNNFLTKPSFSGHETFYCRNLWLKKGYEFLLEGGSFTSSNALHKLGVGKNMVNSIRYWMRVFGLTKNDTPTQLCKLLFDEGGLDPYLEDMTSLWLLHWHLVTTEKATAYTLIFNDLRREKVEFTGLNFVNLANKLASAFNQSFSENTLAADFNVAIRLYVPGLAGGKEPEDGFTGLLTELNLIKVIGRTGDERKENLFAIENTEKPTLPCEIVLYAVLLQIKNNRSEHVVSSSGNGGGSIDFGRLLTNRNSPGAVFALSPQGLYDKLKAFNSHPYWSKDVVFSDQAGVKELQLKRKIDEFEVLEEYYTRSTKPA